MIFNISVQQDFGIVFWNCLLSLLRCSEFCLHRYPSVSRYVTCAELRHRIKRKESYWF